ncbi:LytR/AlgR family response regulator transcription factor [Flavimarina sp. Hel_I_48]|uniref:LytR/AlgR family response regulator transcription factor n=1 Tax=Flavimarina sp. Hel_I_48 TaxID=1392488 RepID=UPI0004DFA0EC|nr:LytTR family DNA-binding domain-containing protein [Flavimarina sp. Hel_I_48]
MSKINCLAIDDEPIALEIISGHLSKIDRLHLVATCTNATEAFNHLSTQQIDLIFLDINMPGVTGIAFAKAINPQTKIVFTTAYREYAIDGFDLQAVDYLLKPISFPRLLKAVEIYLKLHQNTIPTSEKALHEAEFIFVKMDRQMVKISFDSILYVESLSDYIQIYTLEKTYVVREKISSIEKKLPKGKFLRIHRSFIIALAKIESYTHEQLVINANSIPISRSYRDMVLQKLGEFH